MKIEKFKHRNDLKNPFSFEDIAEAYPLSHRKYNVQPKDVAFVNRVLAEIAHLYDLESFDEFCSDLSTQPFMIMKSLTAYFLLSRTKLPLAVIGAFLGGRDHSAVRNLLLVYEKRIAHDSEEDMVLYRFALRRLIRNIPAEIVIRFDKYAKFILLEKLATEKTVT